MWNKVIRIAQPVLAFTLGLVFFFWQSLSPLLPWGLERIIGITIAFAAGLIFYFDQKIERLSARQDTLIHVNISEGIARAIRHVKHPSIIRIFAFSTFIIQPILRDLHVQTKEFKLLLYNSKLPPGEDQTESQAPEDRVPFAPIQEWLFMKRDGLMNELEIRTHEIYPLDYFILFDDNALLVGHYLIHDSRFPKCEVQEPCLVLSETQEGKILIRKQLEVFESLRNSNKSSLLEFATNVT